MKPSHAAALALVGWSLMLPISGLTGSRPIKYSTYTNERYGISFRYPSDWSLKEGSVELDWGYVGHADNALPHGVTVATVELPSGQGDIVLCFVQVRVDRHATGRECYQSSFLDEGEGFYSPQTPAIRARRYPTVKIGAIQFTEAQESNAGLGHVVVSRYYHTFENGICYEFQLGRNMPPPSPDGIEDAFAPMKDILGSVTIGHPTE